jgi:hypothetical protein
MAFWVVVVKAGSSGRCSIGKKRNLNANIVSGRRKARYNALLFFAQDPQHTRPVFRTVAQLARDQAKPSQQVNFV